VTDITKKQESQPQLSLKDKIQTLKDRVHRAKLLTNKPLVCDVSGSMDAYVEDSNLRAIDVLRECVENFEGAPMYAFHSFPERIYHSSKLGEPRGGTEMASAFDLVKKDSFKEIILITDGQPNNESAALKSARGLKIDIIYIGPPPTPTFLEKLAKVTGGKFEKLSLIGPAASKSLEDKVRLLIGDGS